MIMQFKYGATLIYYTLVLDQKKSNITKFRTLGMLQHAPPQRNRAPRFLRRSEKELDTQNGVGLPVPMWLPCQSDVTTEP